MTQEEKSISGGSATQQFYEGALDRIMRLSLWLGLAGVAVAGGAFGLKVALGWTAGSAIAWVNFRSLVKSVYAIGERITVRESRERGGAIVAKFLLRYVLFGVGACAIFKVSAVSLYGMLAGLFLPIAAAFCEAVYETYVALTREF